MEELYYIRTQGYLGNALMWWGHAKCGYTPDITEAGKFSKEDAIDACSRRGERAYLCSVIDSNTEAHCMTIDSQYVSRDDEAFSYESLNKE